MVGTLGFRMTMGFNPPPLDDAELNDRVDIYLHGYLLRQRPQYRKADR
jgi:hypothetical protein